MSTAHVIAKRSTCPRAEVGSVLTKSDGHQVIGHGYNGSPAGLNECTKVGCDLDENGSCTRVVHSEINAVLFCNEDTRGSTLYCTYSPCHSCQKMLINAGIERVVYDNKYRHNFVYLEEAGIEIDRAEPIPELIDDE